MKYTLQIKRYGRLLTYDSLAALRTDLEKYFSLREINGGVVDRLTDFKGEVTNGYIRRHYQDYVTCCYLE